MIVTLTAHFLFALHLMRVMEIIVGQFFFFFLPSSSMTVCVIFPCFLFFGELQTQTDVTVADPRAALSRAGVFMQLKMGHCAQLELPSRDDVTWCHITPATSASVQPSR